MNPKILITGGVGVDIIVRVKKFPIQYKDSYLVPPIENFTAHTGSGVAFALKALGVSLKIIDFIGKDDYGRQIENDFTKSKIDFQFKYDNSGTKRSVNLVDKEGKRLSFYDPRNGNISMPKNFISPLIKKFDHIHITIMNWCAPLFEEAIRHNKTTSTDLHDWDGVNQYHKQFAYKADYVFFSNSNCKKNFKSLMKQIIIKGRAQAVIVTAGSDGAYLLERGKKNIIHSPAIKSDSIIDSNGAGDAFLATFLSGLLDKRSYEECLKLGTIAGMYTCTKAGTHRAFISKRMLYRILKDNN